MPKQNYYQIHPTIETRGLSLDFIVIIIVLAFVNVRIYLCSTKVFLPPLVFYFLEHELNIVVKTLWKKLNGLNCRDN